MFIDATFTVVFELALFKFGSRPNIKERVLVAQPSTLVPRPGDYL